MAKKEQTAEISLMVYTINEINSFLSSFYDDILLFTSYLYYVNKYTYKIPKKIIRDYLFMYGKTKPCIKISKLYSFYPNIDPLVLFNVPQLIRKYGFKKDEDYIVDEEGCVIITPSRYYFLIFTTSNDRVISGVNKLFLYEKKYEEYLRMKNQ